MSLDLQIHHSDLRVEYFWGPETVSPRNPKFKSTGSRKVSQMANIQGNFFCVPIQEFKLLKIFLRKNLLAFLIVILTNKTTLRDIFSDKNKETSDKTIAINHKYQKT